MQRIALACVGVVASPAAWSAEAHPGPGMLQLAELLLGLLVVVGAVLLTARLLSRLQRGHGAGSTDFRVVSALVVGQKERIVLLQAGSTQLLVGVTPAQVATLHVLDAPIVAANPSGSVLSDGWLQRVLARKS